LRFHFPRKFLFRGSFVSSGVLEWWLLPKWTIFLFFHFIYLSLYRLNLLFYLIELFQLFRGPSFCLQLVRKFFCFFPQLLYFLLNSF
jgi:hypothetical protein